MSNQILGTKADVISVQSHNDTRKSRFRSQARKRKVAHETSRDAANDSTDREETPEKRRKTRNAPTSTNSWADVADRIARPDQRKQQNVNGATMVLRQANPAVAVPNHVASQSQGAMNMRECKSQRGSFPTPLKAKMSKAASAVSNADSVQTLKNVASDVAETTSHLASSAINGVDKSAQAAFNGGTVLGHQSQRNLPNIAIAGTPATGKTTLAKRLVKALGSEFHYLDFAKCEEAKSFRVSYDESRKSWVIDEDALAKHLTPKLKREGGYIIDWIHADMFDPAPMGPIDLCVTVRADETCILYDRLKSRCYSDAKIDENMDAEIMGEVAEENREVFGEEVQDGACSLLEVQSQHKKQLKEAMADIQNWIIRWDLLNGHGDSTKELKRLRVRSLNPHT